MRRWPGQPVILIDLPRRCERALYERTIGTIVDALSTTGFVDSVYQVGGLRHPGISDLDLLIVVSDDSRWTDDPLARLPADGRYLFTHSCFVVQSSLAPDLGKHALLQGHRWLFGTKHAWTCRAKAGATTRALEVQTALEFLAKNVLDLHVQLTYGMLKVRTFLQHLKGVKTDLEILGIEEVPIVGILESAMSLIDDWFERVDREQEVTQLAIELLPLMRDAFSDAAAQHTLYAPLGGPISFAPNMSLKPAAAVAIQRRGLRLPRIRGLRERRQFNANHKVNRFEVRLPMTLAPAGSYHAHRFEFLRHAKVFAAQRFPAFSAPIPPLFYRVL